MNVESAVYPDDVVPTLTRVLLVGALQRQKVPAAESGQQCSHT